MTAESSDDRTNLWGFVSSLPLKSKQNTPWSSMCSVESVGWGVQMQQQCYVGFPSLHADSFAIQVRWGCCVHYSWLWLSAVVAWKRTRNGRPKWLKEAFKSKTIQLLFWMFNAPFSAPIILLPLSASFQPTPHHPPVPWHVCTKATCGNTRAGIHWKAKFTCHCFDLEGKWVISVSKATMSQVLTAHISQCVLMNIRRG